MKKFKNHSTFYGMQDAFIRSEKNEMTELISRTRAIRPFSSGLATLIMFCLSAAFYGCGKPSDNPTPPPVVNISACVIASDVDQAVGVRNFEYDDKGLLVKMTAPNYYYGPFIRTISPANAIDAYPSASVDGQGNHTYANIKLTYTYTGGSGNIYDGNPGFMHQVFAVSNPPSSTLTDSLYQFVYDDAKKHLTTVLMPGNGSKNALGFTNFRNELSFTYDDNDNVKQIKIIYDYSQKTTVYPSGESRIDYVQQSDELLTITYDDKPSPYTAISKYWKFIGNDISGFGAYNLDKLRFWANRVAIMSKNNPTKITGKLITVGGSPAADINATLTYQYNDKNFPTSMAINGQGVQAFTYSCK